MGDRGMFQTPAPSSSPAVQFGGAASSDGALAAAQGQQYLSGPQRAALLFGLPQAFLATMPLLAMTEAINWAMMQGGDTAAKKQLGEMSGQFGEFVQVCVVAVRNPRLAGQRSSYLRRHISPRLLTDCLSFTPRLLILTACPLSHRLSSLSSFTASPH